MVMPKDTIAASKTTLLQYYDNFVQCCDEYMYIACT